MADKGKWLLFAGDHYYPGGGKEDFKGAFTTRQDAEMAAAAIDYGWQHIYDAENGVWHVYR